MYDEIEALGPDASDADIMKIREKYSDLSSEKIASFYGIDMPREPFKLDWKLAKGGKVDRALQISKQMDKRYLAQLKNTNKQIDRLSKVTYKAILKSLGLK